MKRFLNFWSNYKKWLKKSKNIYIISSVVFLIWIVFFDSYSLFDHLYLQEQISELESNKAFYQTEIKKDSIKINQLKKIDMVEKYAREKYFMKKENEDIYIIEFEGDSIAE